MLSTKDRLEAYSSKDLFDIVGYNKKFRIINGNWIGEIVRKDDKDWIFILDSSYNLISKVLIDKTSTAFHFYILEVLN